MKIEGKGYFAIVLLLLLTIGWLQSWNVALGILNLCLISAVMALGVNIQWGYAGLFNVGIMGFAALGGLSAVLISVPPVKEAWQAGGLGILYSLLVLIATTIIIKIVRQRVDAKWKLPVSLLLVLLGVLVLLPIYDQAVESIERIDPAKTGFLGGFGLPIAFSWIVGGIIAAGAAWVIGKISLGLRSDYLAIATLGISEIIIAVIKYEEWLTRGVKNVTGLPRPVPYEVDLVTTPWVVDLAQWFNTDVSDTASIIVKLSYAAMFLIVLAIVFYFSESALRSPWGRMIRAVRDNRDAANAMGKDITKLHLKVFILGCAVCGIAGAMLTTLDGQLTPSSYIPLRYTFLIWVMVILGGSGNNSGSILGGFIVWFLWIEAEPLGHALVQFFTFPFADDYWLKQSLLDKAVYGRLVMMGLILLLVLRFAPKGLIPER